MYAWLPITKENTFASACKVLLIKKPTLILK